MFYTLLCLQYKNTSEIKKKSKTLEIYHHEKHGCL